MWEKKKAFGTVSRQTLSQKCYEQIKESILSRDIMPGERLQEVRIANMLDVSPAPVREAFRMLAMEGLIRIDPWKGAVVQCYSSEEILDVVQCRVALETLALKLAYQNMGEQLAQKIEEDIADMSKEDKQLFLDELGLESSGLDRLIQKGYELLGLISYLTAGKQEVRAWTIKKGTKAPQAAGKIHSDFEKGFIRAEVVAFDDLEACGSMAAAKEKGLVRSEGKEYVFQDGDVVLFRFNV